jgi:hypothetical protein
MSALALARKISLRSLLLTLYSQSLMDRSAATLCLRAGSSPFHRYGLLQVRHIYLNILSNRPSRFVAGGWLRKGRRIERPGVEPIVHMSRISLSIRRRPDRVGEHTGEVSSEIGCPEDEILEIWGSDRLRLTAAASQTVNVKKAI